MSTAALTTGSRGKDRKNGIPGRVDDSTPMALDVAPEVLPASIQSGDGAELVPGHQARIAFHIGREDPGQSMAQVGQRRSQETLSI